MSRFWRCGVDWGEVLERFLQDEEQGKTALRGIATAECSRKVR
jgi:hypothetical protein